MRERARLAREVEDALVQNTQGLILKVHGIVRHLEPDDPLRRRVEQALDRADEQLSDDRDRVQDLRNQSLLDGELLRKDDTNAP
jgi:signal transduction histidine kinase